MRTRFSQRAVLALCLIAAVQVYPLAANGAASPIGDEEYAGKWEGTYTSEDGGSGKVSLTLTKGENGRWRGNIMYTNQNGDQTAEFKTVQIENDKFKAGFESPDGSVGIALEGKFQEGRFEGTYSVVAKDSKESVEKGTWKTTKRAD